MEGEPDQKRQGDIRCDEGDEIWWECSKVGGGFPKVLGGGARGGYGDWGCNAYCGCWVGSDTACGREGSVSSVVSKELEFSGCCFLVV